VIDLTSRERILAALSHKQPDRCPIDLGSNGQTGMNVSTLYRFRKALGLDNHRLKVIEPFQMLGEVEPDLLKLVGSDMIGLWNRGTMLGYRNENWKPWQMDDGTPVYMAGGFSCETDERGSHWVHAQCDPSAPIAACMPKGGSFFDNVAHAAEPFDNDADEDDLTPLEDYKDDFSVATDEDARYWEEQSKLLYDGTQYGIMGVLGGAGLGDVALVPGPAIKYPKGIRRIDDWLAAHAAFPEYLEAVYAYQTEIMLKNLEIYHQAVGERIQVVWISGTDFGTQAGTFTSLPAFRRLYKPYYKKINDWVHQNTGWKTFYHTCGCVNNLLDDFVEMGMDCLNPVQFSAMEPKGMTPQRLKEQYGEKLTFWGGGVDTQRVLPFGTPDEVRAQVAQRVQILNRDGGFVFSSIHNVVANVPAENLIAMYETVLNHKLI
jgi:uroporphyrinogen-III decarboxylase